MTDSHAQLEAWLVDGALGAPPREIAVHATLCESCTARLGAFDALALIDVAAAGSPPPLAAPTRLRMGVAWARLGTAIVGAVVAGILVVFGVSQLFGLVGPGAGPNPTDVVALASAVDGGPAQSRHQSGGDSTPAEAPTPSGFETPLPGVTPGPLLSLLPDATPRPPTPFPSASPAPTPTPVPLSTPTSSPTESPSEQPSETPSPIPTPTPTPTETPSPSP